MKKERLYRLLPLGAFLLGLMGQCLYRLVYAFAMDEKGLMVPFHPLTLALWLLTAAAAAAAGILTLGVKEGKDAPGFSAGRAGAAGDFVMAACVAGTVLFQMPAMGGTLGEIWKWLGILAGLGLCWTGYTRLTGKRSFFAAHLPVCLFLTVHIMTHYRAWSSCPELLDYVFSLLACACLTAFACGQMVWDVGQGKRRPLVLTGLLTVYFAAVAICADPYRFICGGGAVWAAANLLDFRKPEEYAHDGNS